VKDSLKFDKQVRSNRKFVPIVVRLLDYLVAREYPLCFCCVSRVFARVIGGINNSFCLALGIGMCVELKRKKTRLHFVI
jgi:hypothetical protein